jgi:hypothetical protein
MLYELGKSNKIKIAVAKKAQKVIIEKYSFLTLHLIMHFIGVLSSLL